MKITSTLALRYLNKNKKRSLATIIRYSSWNNIINYDTYTNIEL